MWRSSKSAAKEREVVGGGSQRKALAFMSPAHAGPLQCDTLRELFRGRPRCSPNEFQPRNGARCRSNVPLKTRVNVGASQEKVSGRGCFLFYFGKVLFWFFYANATIRFLNR